MNNLFYQEAVDSLQHINKDLDALVKQVKQMPRGKLIISKDRKWEKWYVSNNGKTIYLPKKMRIKAEELAQKRYLEATIRDLLEEKEAIEAYIARHNEKMFAEEILKPESRYASLIERPDEYPKEVMEWLAAPFIQNPNYPEQKRYQSITGNMVRSKSEMMIEDALYRNHIPYHYEEQIKLPNGKIVYPDFRIYNLRRRQFMFWEHNGMMDDPKYFQNQYIYKTNLYAECGIYPNINYIMTFETKDHPLSYEQINNIIRQLVIS